MIFRRRAVLALCASVLAVLAACTTAGTPTAAAPAGPAAVPDEPFAAALTRFGGGVRGVVEFVDLRAVATGSGTWSQLVSGGRLGPYAQQLAERLRIDVLGADWTATASAGGPLITLVAGGQDAAAIRTAAEAAGWTGADVLARDLAVAEPLTVQAATIRPIGADVVVGGARAPVELVDGPGPALADDPQVAALRDCLGQGLAVVMLHRPERGSAYAVGAAPAPDDPAGAVSTVCATHETPAAATDRAAAVRADAAPGAAAPWGGALVDPQVTELGGPANVVRLTGRNAADRPPTFVVGQMSRQDLPGGIR